MADNTNILPSDQNFYRAAGFESSSTPGLVMAGQIDEITGRILTDSAGGSGTVTIVSVVTANGVSGSVATATTTPAITLTLGAITPTSVNGASSTEIGYLVGVTSAIQTQLNAKGAGTVTSVGFTGGLISVATATTTPALTVAGTSGGIPYFSSASTWATSAALAANAIVIGGGAGAAPSTITTGTGVLTGLGVNVGSAGAFVTFNGALGTPSSGTVTNLTGTASININGTVGATTPTTIVGTTINATTGFRVNGSATSRKILVGDGTNMVLSTETYAVPGTSGNVLTSDGTNWTSAAPASSSGTPTVKSVANFEDIASNRYTETNAGGGNTTVGASGAELATSISSTSSTSLTWALDNSNNILAGSPIFTCRVYGGNLEASGNGSTYFGIGDVTVSGSGHTYTTRHIGFKVLRAGGTFSLYATQADGSTETTSSALTTIVTGDSLDLIAKVNGTSSVDYYWRKNGGALSSATNLTGNFPSTASDNVVQFSASNDAGTNFITMVVQTASYER